MITEITGQVPQKKEFYQVFSNINDPGTLAIQCTPGDLESLPTHFIAYRDQSDRVDRVEHMNGDTLIESFRYIYQNPELVKITWLKYQDDVSDRCQIDFTTDTRHTQCFYKSGSLYTEEWLNIRTTEYQFGRYDEHGKLIYGEHGSYAPK